MSNAPRKTRRAAPASDAPKRRPGRPKGATSKWTVERRTAIVATICAHVAVGGLTTDLLPKVAADNPEMPTWMVFRGWLEPGQPKADEFHAAYTRARDSRLDVLEEQFLRSITDGRNDTFFDPVAQKWRENTEVLGRARLQSDGLKWYLSKLKRRDFGEAVDITSKGEQLQPGVAVAMPHVVPLGAPLDAADIQHKPQGKRGKR